MKIQLDCHFNWEKLEQNHIFISHVRRGEQLVDLFTEALTGAKIDFMRNKQNMINIYLFTFGLRGSI